MDLTLKSLGQPLRFAGLPSTTAPRKPVTPLQNGPAEDLFFGSAPAAKKPPYTDFDLVNRLVQLGTGDAKDQVGFRVSRYFSADKQDHDTTYGQLLEDTQRTAAGFEKRGLSGKKIAVAETNSLDFLSTWYGGLAVGATMLPINLLAMQDKNTKIQKLMHMVGGPKSDAFIYGADPLFEAMDKFKTVQKLKAPIVGSIIKRLTKKSDSDFARIFTNLPKELITPEAKAKFRRLKPMPVERMLTSPNPNAIANIIFTSGTSGNPKGVALSHKNLNFTTQSLSEGTSDLLRADDVMLLGLPLFHIFGQAVMLTGVTKGIQQVMLPSLRDALGNLPDVAKTMKEYNVTVLPAVPVFLEKVVAEAAKNPEMAEAVKNLRVIISGGAPLKKATYDALSAINPNLRIIEGYGSSEAGINMFNKEARPGYVGHALPGVQVKMLNSKEGVMKGWSQSSGEGEILVKSPGVAAGYVAGTLPDVDPATVNKNGLVPIVSPDGWFHTGDQGKRAYELREGFQEGDFGSQKLGPMQIVGRESNFIKDSGGERRDPTEFENAVRQASPQVTDAMAIAYKPDRETEKSVVVAVSSDPSVSEESIKAAMSAQVTAGQLAGALIPKHVIVLHRDTLPDAFKNDFKREAGYKVAKAFINQIVADGLVELRDKSGTERERTVQPNPAALHDFANAYQFKG